MQRAHVIRLNPTKEQEVYFRKACGVARHAYNWALARWKEYRAQGIWAKMKDLKAEYNRLKKEQFPWVYEVTKWPVSSFLTRGYTIAVRALHKRLERRQKKRFPRGPASFLPCLV